MINQVVARAHRIGHATNHDDRPPVVVESVIFHKNERQLQAAQEDEGSRAADLEAVWRKTLS
jgi:hypothetical protein